MIGVRDHWEIALAEDRNERRIWADILSRLDADEDEPFESWDDFCRRELSFLDRIPEPE